MKNKRDPRHQHRILLMQSIFAWDVDRTQIIPEITAEQLAESDKLILEHAPKWPIDKINKLDLAILRLAFYELKFHPQTPPRVIIDEAIEIAKLYGAESSPSFINGVLGGWLKHAHTT